MELAFEPQGETLVVRAPETPEEAVPGPSMVFVLDREGVPSVGKMVRVG